MTLRTLPPPLPLAGAAIAHHIARTSTDLPKRRGVTYIWATNGVFKHAWNGQTRAMVQISHHRTPGLGELRPFVSWKGWPRPLPAAPLNAALADAIERYKPEAPQERQWFIVLRGGEPALVTPVQEGGVVHLSYQMPEGLVLADVHSHHGMPPFFSGTDNADDAWLGLSIVIGRLGSPHPSAVARINCYGHHHDIELSAIVEGELRVGELALVPEREALRRDGRPFLPDDEYLDALIDAPDGADGAEGQPFDKQAAIRGHHEDADDTETAAGQ